MYTSDPAIALVMDLEFFSIPFERPVGEMEQWCGIGDDDR